MRVIYFELLCFFRYPSSSGVCTNQTYSFANCEISQMLRGTQYNKIVPAIVPHVANKLCQSLQYFMVFYEANS